MAMQRGDSLLIQNGLVLHYDRLEAGSDLRIENGRIVALGPNLEPRAAERIIDASKCYVLPGLIDLHTHGLRDVLVQEGRWTEFSGLQLEQGVTACVPTLFAAPEVTIASIKTGLIETEHFIRTPNLLGFRLEMPYVFKPGAGIPSLRAGITLEITQALYDTAEGFIKIWDVSPELEGAIPFIGWAKERGIVTSLAHSSASVEETRRAIEAGLSLITHFYDTFDVAVQTDPGVYPAGLTDYIQVEDRLTVEIIPDGVHVHPYLIEKTFRCKGVERIAFITDSVKGAGNPPGVYSGLYEGVEVAVTPDRGVRRTSDDILSGSSLTQLKSFQNAVYKFGKSIVEASILCSRTPAQVLGLERKGYLALGMDADVILLDKSLELKTTILAGEVLYQV
jgi:N-acetylglucosamine-6-phosphate deacetylase